MNSTEIFTCQRCKKQFPESSNKYRNLDPGLWVCRDCDGAGGDNDYEDDCRELFSRVHRDFDLLGDEEQMKQAVLDALDGNTPKKEFWYLWGFAKEQIKDLGFTVTKKRKKYIVNQTGIKN